MTDTETIVMIIDMITTTLITITIQPQADTQQQNVLATRHATNFFILSVLVADNSNN